MHEHDERPAQPAVPPIEPGRKPVAARHRQQQALAAWQLRRDGAHGIAQSLQVASEPRRPFLEWRNRPARHVHALPHRRHCLSWRQPDCRRRLRIRKWETFLYGSTSGGLVSQPDIKPEPTESGLFREYDAAKDRPFTHSVFTFAVLNRIAHAPAAK
jgi:hypothetical protein